MSILVRRPMARGGLRRLAPAVQATLKRPEALASVPGATRPAQAVFYMMVSFFIGLCLGVSILLIILSV